MPPEVIRAAVVGASTLLGKELAEQLNEPSSSRWDLQLLDSEEAAGQVTAAGDEAAVIQAVTADSFTGIDLVFFAGDRASTAKYWRDAANAGASVVDLTGALEGEENVSVRSPLTAYLGSTGALDLSSIACVSAHPASVMLAAVVSRLNETFAPIQVSVTVLEPASQQGAAGLDEMHEQTVSLLSFKPLPQEVFDAQVAFNALAQLGESARVPLRDTASIVRRHLELIGGAHVAKSTAVQLVQAPVFSGYTASAFVATTSALKVQDIERALKGGIVRVPPPDDPPPSNQAAAQSGDVLVQVTPGGDSSNEPQGFWLWMATDNLRLATRNAVACALELLALRPGKHVQ